MILFTSDTHFWHKAIITYCNRPWTRPDGQPDVEAMNAALIENWNAEVRPGDTVYHLGDFGFGGVTKLREVRAKLNGRIVLIKGNHDHKTHKWLKPEDKVYPHFLSGSVFMAHIPPVGEVPADNVGLPFHVPPENAEAILCGHVHDLWWSKAYTVGTKTTIIRNVGVEFWDYRPVTAEELGVAGLLDPNDVL